MNTRTILLATGSMLAAATAHGQAVAQTSAPAAAVEAPIDNVGVGDIIVTARKRQESILNVPVIETAIPASVLEQRQTTELKDIAKLTPGLALAQSNGALGTQISLRGIGTTAINAGIDASVSLNIDGQQMTQAQAYAAAVFDVAQVEVLKGPQNLFYGKNSPGGVIAVRSADPTDKFELIARYGYEFEAREHHAELIVSGPITDTLLARLGGQYESQDGFFYNDETVVPAGYGARALPSDRLNPDKNYIVRGTILWKPSTKFDARLKVTATHDKMIGGDAQQVVSCPDGTAGPVTALFPGGIPFLGGTDNCRQDRHSSFPGIDPAAFPGVKNGGVLYHTTAQQFASLELNYRPLPDITVTSETAYYHMTFHSLGSGSGSVYAAPSFVSIAKPLARHDFTQELRANSDFSGPVNFTVGGYYQDGWIDNHIDLVANQVERLVPAVYVGRYQEIVGIKSYSLFGQARWKIADKLELAGGARWTDEKRHLDAYNWATGVPVYFPTAVPDIHSSHVAPEATLTYKPDENVTLFASYKTGFKSGMFTLTSLGAPNPNLAFGDEKARGGEGGVKARLFDRRLTTSLAFYDYLYKGLQVGAVQPVAAGAAPVNATVNAGAARTYGVDFDVAYRPAVIEGMTLNAAVNWNHAKFKSLVGVPCWGGQTIGEGCNQVLNPVTGRYTAQDLSGTDLPRAPRWQASFGVNYEMPVGRGMKVILTNSNQVASRYVPMLGTRPDFFQSGYFKADLAATLQGPHDRWEFGIVGKNIGNKITSYNCLSGNVQYGTIGGGQTTGTAARPATGAGVDEVQCYLDRGREIWLRVTWKPFN